MDTSRKLGPRRVETRLICTTSKNLGEEIGAGKFRADLYYYINVLRLRLPRIRERGEDSPLVAEYFWAQFQEKFSKESEPLSVEMLQYLQNWIGPGIFASFRMALPATS